MRSKISLIAGISPSSARSSARARTTQHFSALAVAVLAWRRSAEFSASRIGLLALPPSGGASSLIIFHLRCWSGRAN
jgi:hypothetical protein